MQFSAMLRTDAVHHASGVECPHYFPRPLLALNQPTQQNGEDFVRIDDVAMFIDSANPVGVSIRSESGLTMFFDHCLLQLSKVRQDRFRIDPGKQRVRFAVDLNAGNIDATENSRQNSAACSVHGIDSEFEPAGCDLLQVDKSRDLLNVSGKKIHLLNFGCHGSACQWLAQARLDGSYHGWLARPAVAGFELNSIPLEGIVA